LFVVPVGSASLQNVREIDFDVYCVDRYQKGRANVPYVISDTDLILADLSLWLEEGQNDIEVVRSYPTTPINNDLLDYVGGHVMRLRVQVDRIALCEIPFDGDAPIPPSCPSGFVRNSDNTYVNIVPSGGTVMIPDITVTDSDGSTYTQPAVTDVVCTLAPPCEDATYEVEYENGTPITSGSIPSGGFELIVVPNPITCEDATAELYFDGDLIDAMQIPAGDTDSFNIDCSTTLNAVRVTSVSLSHAHTGTFVYIGDVNGKPSYEKSDDADRIIYYDGTQWILEKLGGGAHTHEAAIGNEAFPWLADWSLEDISMVQATIGTYCVNGGDALNILVNGNIEGDVNNAYDVEIDVTNSIGDVVTPTTTITGNTVGLELPDETINIVDEFNNPLDTITFPVYTDPNIDITTYCPTAPDTDLEVNGTPEGTFAAGSTIDVRLNNTTPTIVTPFVTVIGNLVELEIPDSDVNVNGNLEGTVASAEIIDIDVTDGVNPVTPNAITISGNTVTIEVPSGGGGAPVGATLMKTGQTTSYRTGDDGNLQAGRATDFFTLASNNPFGNTNRFTDTLGGSTYTNNIVIDWSTYDGSTVLGWRRTTTNATWNNAVDGALLVSIGTFTSGWRLPNVMELFSLKNWNLADRYNYAPINQVAQQFWTSNTRIDGTTEAFYVWGSNFRPVQSIGKTNIIPYIPVRTFTVTGTTLT
jgi:hypothetical protein